LWKALNEAMANIKLNKNMFVSFRFPVADESRLLVVLQFSVFFAERFSCEKHTLLLMLNFNNYCLSVGRFPRLFTAFSLIAVQKKKVNTQSLKNIGQLFDSLLASVLLISKSR